MDEVRKVFSQNQQATQEFARAVMDVQEIGGVLFVDGAAGSLYIHPNRGQGAYADPDTPFYVDSTGRFSLKNLLTFDPETRTLTVEGTIIADSGRIGGWDISPTTLSKNNAVLDSAGQLLLGTGNDVVIISATDATYRLWVGNATAGTATFSVTKTGALFSTAGTIGGFSIGTDYLRDTANSFGLASTVTGGDDVRFWAGDTFANRATAPFRLTESGLLYASGATIVGNVTFASTNRVLATDNASYLTWQGSTGLNVPGFYAQHEAGAAGGFVALGVGTNATSAVFLTKARGSFGALTAIATDDIIGVTAYQGYNGATWSTYILQRGGITNSTSTPYWFVEINSNVWVFNYDGKLYFQTAEPANAYGSPYVADSTANLYRSAAGTIKTDGNFVATNLTGAGANITSISATNISTGTLDNARLPTAISVSSLTASGEIRGATARFGAFTGIPDTPVIGWVDLTDNGGTARRVAIV